MDDTAFLNSQGEMAGHIRACDWSRTDLGAIADWPASLKAVVGMMTAARNAMVLLWGPRGVLIYNDGYAAFAGERHPDVLGRPHADAWPEIAAFNDENLRRGLAGEAWSLRDQELMLDRGRGPETAFLDLDYAPVPDDTGRSAGVLVFVTETTAQKVADARRREANQRLDLALSAGSGVGTWDWDVPADRVYADDRFARIYGVDPAVAAAGAPIGEFFHAMHPDDAERVQSLIAGALASGDLFKGEYRLVQPDGEVRWVAAEGRAQLDPDGRAIRFPGVTFDITERHRLSMALQVSQQRYRTLLDSMQIGFCIVRMKFDEAGKAVDYQIIEGNPAYERMTGLVGSAGKWVSEIAPGLERHWFDLYGGVALTGQAVRFENPADILGRWYDVQALRIGEPEDRLVAILFNDITGRRAAEARQSALIALADAIRDLKDPDAIAQAGCEVLAMALGVSRAGYGTVDAAAETITIDRDFNQRGVVSIVGQLSVRDFGSYVEDLKRGVTVVIDDVAADPRTADRADALKNISAASFINMPLIENGEVVALAFVNHAEPRAWDDEDVQLVRDIAERVRAAGERVRADALRRDSESRYQALFDAVDEGFCIIEFVDGPNGPLDDYVHVEANAAYAENAGIQDVVGQHVRDMVPDEADEWVRLYREVLLTGRPIRFEKELRATARWLELAAFRVEPRERNQVAVLFKDLTARKLAERALEEMNVSLEERVHDRTRELMEAHEALRQSQKMEAVGQLTGGIAHDFNNLLAGISGSLELLNKRLAEGRLAGMERYIDAAQGAAQRATSLTQRLLAFSRRQTLDPRPTDVNRLIAGMEDLVRRSVGPDIEVEVVGAGGLWPVRIDQSQLENALLNLAINARDAMAPDGGRLTIETANKWLDERHARARDLAPGQYVSLCVTDTGTGMSAETIEKIFDPFFTTKPLGQGTGLGLSMIHGFVRQSGGQVRVYSEIGEGTTMCLYLPRYAGEVDDIDPVAAALQSHGHGETVLVIDDEPTVRMLVVEVLQEAGYKVIEAPDGPSGLRILESDARVDLLITDVGLPGGMNGRQVADAARVSRPALKVLFITGYAENAAVGNGLLEPGMEVMTKPFVMADLAAKATEMIDG